MLDIQKYSNKIELTKGDTARIQIAIFAEDGQYFPEQGDVIRFAMKRDFSDKNAALEKTIPNGTMILELLPSDTSGLDRGSYVYDVQITLENGDVFTFIEGDFILRGDVK